MQLYETAMSTTVHFFTIPALAPLAAEQALNRFLAAHRVVVVEKQWVAAGIDSAWAVCVTVALGQGPLPAELKRPSAKMVRTERVDYREILSPDDFAVFATLRSLRKDLAEQEGVPIYAFSRWFTNWCAYIAAFCQCLFRRCRPLVISAPKCGCPCAVYGRYCLVVQ
jgi:hypothetical protein